MKVFNNEKGFHSLCECNRRNQKKKIPDRCTQLASVLKAWSDRQTQGKRTKHTELGYPVTKFISSDARHITTVHQTGVSVRFVRWKVLNMLKTSNWTKRTSPTSPDKERIHRIGNEHTTYMNG